MRITLKYPYMKLFTTTFLILILPISALFAQTGREVHGTIIDSTKQTIPGSTIQLTSEQGESQRSTSDANGKFIFNSIKGNKIVITVSSIGYDTIRKHFALPADNVPAQLGFIILKTRSSMLNQVNIVGVIPIVLKEDTVEYKASAFKVRENAPVEDLIKKLPGVDVDVNGNITTQGKQVTKVRINGKDFMGGDVQSATKNLPADVVENIQMIDDYGDQANLTGIKTGEPDKIMNITIRKDKNYGYFGQATIGDGEDALPASQGIPNDDRYIGSLNAFKFNGDQQIAVLGSINNTNVNTFSFGSANPGGGGGGGFGGGGGRGNAARGGQNNGSLTTTQNGLTNAHSIGANFRDQWGKELSVYGSYSFSDNTVNTTNNIFQQNTSYFNPSLQKQNSVVTNENTNHRFTWNMEYKPDTANYLKVTPTFSYAGTNTFEKDTVSITKNLLPITNYNAITNGNSQAPTYGLTTLYNHKFKHRRNFSINLNFSSAKSSAFENPVYNFLAGKQTSPLNQLINTYSNTNTFGTTLSYLEPISRRSYLEFNYSFNRSITDNNKQDDSTFNASIVPFKNDSALSNVYNYTYTTNKFGINYRFIEKKYNLTLGLGAQPGDLVGSSATTGKTTNVSTFNYIPTARFTYNFSRSRNFSVNYNGSSSAPSFSQLQPVIDFSNATYPVEGNPNLKPQFSNNFSIRYNNFSFATGDIFFASIQYQQISNYIATNTISFPSNYLPDKRFENTLLTQYQNTDGYYNTSGQLTYAKPFDKRKFTLYFRGTVTYTNNIGYISNVNYASINDTNNYVQTKEKNTAKNLQFTPQFQFRVDIPDVVDAQLLTNYAINKTNNSIINPLTSSTSNIRTWNVGLNGKNYFGDWTISYDYTKATNYGYAATVKVTNPNILNTYIERRFLKDHRGTLRLSAFDLFNENTGFSSTQTASSITETHVNRLARYYLATFTLRLQKFAGKVPTQDNGIRNFRRQGAPEGGPL